MLDNSLIRFILFIIVAIAFYFVLRRFLSGWKREESEWVSTDELEADRPDKGAAFRAPRRSESRIQQPLEAPEPDNLVSEAPTPRRDTARRIQVDSRAIDIAAAQKRPQHRHPQRNSRPAKGRKIQL